MPIKRLPSHPMSSASCDISGGRPCIWGIKSTRTCTEAACTPSMGAWGRSCTLAKKTPKYKGTKACSHAWQGETIGTQQEQCAPVVIKEATSLAHPQFPGSLLALYIYGHRIYLLPQCMRSFPP